MSASKLVLPVILAGGGGTRLWPLSRGYYPKQFLAVGGELSLLQQTLARLVTTEDTAVDGAMVVCNEEHRFLVAEQIRQSGQTVNDLILEPTGRNTAPALTAAALRAMRHGEDPIMVMMPADHLIADQAAFDAAINAAVAEADAGQVVTLGVVPMRAEVGYGYIETGERRGEEHPARHQLQTFREKPDIKTAETYIASENFLWNSGVYILRASVWLELIERHQPDIAAAAAQSVEAGVGDGDFFRLDKEAFSRCPSDSIDYAVMEPLSAGGAGAVVVSLDAGWSDIGSWSSLWEVSDKDAQDNVTRGDVYAHDSTGNIVFAEHRLVATLGCENLAIIETADSVMVADKSKTENVKAIVEWLAEQNRDERLTHRRVYRPWGSYESIDSGVRFQVKHITVNAAAALSLQMHHHRAEHWIVASGTARVTRGEETFLLTENESTYIPIGTVHRLENPGTLPLELIEVQSGSYLGEDDIVRFEDRYKRV
jgi:mannose-1-phosphate guanylyltransferase / mannose-6-phosphate isomerase